jgi:hypothetical protein
MTRLPDDAVGIEIDVTDRANPTCTLGNRDMGHRKQAESGRARDPGKVGRRVINAMAVRRCVQNVWTLER